MLCPRCGEREKVPGADYCRPCKRAYNRAWMALHRKPEKPATKARAESAWARRNREKKNAHKAVEYALRKGTLTRPDACERCGRKCKPQAHHHDYAKPLDVEWICSTCHGKEHRA